MVPFFKVFKNRGMLVSAVVMALIFALGVASVAWAHENVTIGDYVVEYGWVNEPAVVGQPNAVVINFSAVNAAPGSDANIDVSGLKIQAAYGGQNKALELQPLGENAPGQFIAPVTPMRAGKYTFHLSGTVGKTAFNNDMSPEEVKTADVVQFPVLDAQAAGDAGSSANLWMWLAVVGLVLGAAGTILGIAALARKPAKG